MKKILHVRSLCGKGSGSLFLFSSLFLLMMSVQSCVTVFPGEVVMLQKHGVLLPQTYTQGRHWYAPFGMRVISFSTKVQEYSAKMDLPTKEGLEITADMTLLYHLAPDSVRNVYRSFGMNYDKVLVLNSYLTVARQVGLDYSADDLITEREALENTIKDKLKASIGRYGFVVDAVMVKDIDLPDEVLSIIKNKVKTEQTSKQFEVDMEIKTKQLEFDLEKQRKEAEFEMEKQKKQQEFDMEKQKKEQEFQIEKQRVDLDFAIEKQKKEAELLIVNAEAQKKAQTLLNETITDKTIKLKTIEASVEWAKSENTKLIITDGKTPIFMNGGLMNMDMEKK